MRISHIHNFVHAAIILAAICMLVVGIRVECPDEYFVSILTMIFSSIMLIYFSRLFKDSTVKLYLFQVFSFSVILSVHFPIISHFLNFNNPAYKSMIANIPVNIFIEASFFTVFFIAVFCVGLYLINFRYTVKNTRDNSFSFTGNKIFWYSITIFIAQVLLLLADIFLGASNPENTAQIGFITRFIPQDLFFFSAIFLLINLPSGKIKERYIFIAYVLLFLIKSILMGVRGAFILPFFMSFFILVFTKPNSFIDKKYAIYIAVIIGLLPVYLSITSLFKSNIHADVSDRKEIVIEENLDNVEFSGVADWIFGRFQGYTYLVKAMGNGARGVEDYISLSSIVESTIGSIIPDKIYKSDVPSLGGIASVFFNGLSWDNINAGAMFIFALTWIWLGWLGILFSLISLMIVKYYIGYFYNPLSYMSTVQLLFIIWIFFFSFTISGNIDYLVANLFTNLVSFNFIISVLGLKKL